MIIGSQFKGDIVGKSWWPEWEAAGPHASTVGKQREMNAASRPAFSVSFSFRLGPKIMGRFCP